MIGGIVAEEKKDDEANENDTTEDIDDVMFVVHLG